jgi:hypothetical protein
MKAALIQVKEQRMRRKLGGAMASGRESDE